VGFVLYVKQLVRFVSYIRIPAADMIIEQKNLLAGRMGMTAHISPLLQKAKRLGLLTPEDLETLALQRGLRYFGTPDRTLGISLGLFSNEELVIALMSPSSPYSLNRLRMAGALMAANDISVEKLIHLARQERCETIVRHIAQCGMGVEPENPFWKKLLEVVPDDHAVPIDVLPHVSRFTAMTGINREGKNLQSQWIRPVLVESTKR